MCGTDRALLPSPYNGLWLPRRSAARYNTAGALEEAIDAISRGTPQFRQPRARSLKCHEIAVRRQRFRAKPVAGNQDPRPPIGRRGPVVRAGAHRLPSEHVQYSRANESRACPFATSHSKALQVSAAKRVRAHTVHTKRCKRLTSIVNRADPSSGPRTIDGLSYSLESVNICSVLIAPRDFILADERSPCLNAGSRKSYHLPIASPSKRRGWKPK
jgi:hypothetical protein